MLMMMVWFVLMRWMVMFYRCVLGLMISVWLGLESLIL